MKENITLSIGKMHCASCAAVIQRSLTKVPGVKSANVNYATKKAAVEYAPGQAGPKQFEEAIKAKEIESI